MALQDFKTLQGTSYSGERMPKHRQDNDSYTRKYYEGHGFTVAKVEFHNHFSGHKHDLYGFADYLCCNGIDPIIACQTTSYGADYVRVRKILAEPRALLWLASGGRIIVHGWRRKPKLNKDGTYSATQSDYAVREIEIDLTWPFPKDTRKAAKLIMRNRDDTWRLKEKIKSPGKRFFG